MLDYAGNADMHIRGLLLRAISQSPLAGVWR